MSTEETKHLINTVIVENENGDITAENLNTVLNSVVDGIDNAKTDLDQNISNALEDIKSQNHTLNQYWVNAALNIMPLYIRFKEAQNGYGYVIAESTGSFNPACPLVFVEEGNYELNLAIVEEMYIIKNEGDGAEYFQQCLEYAGSNVSIDDVHAIYVLDTEWQNVYIYCNENGETLYMLSDYDY